MRQQVSARIHRLKHAARLLDISMPTLYRWHNRGLIKFVRYGTINGVTDAEIDRLTGGNDQQARDAQA